VERAPVDAARSPAASPASAGRGAVSHRVVARKTTSTMAVLSGLLAASLASCADDSATPPPTTIPAATSTAPVAMEGDFAGLVDVGGRNLYLDCRGTGSPTVVLLSGFGDAGDFWSFALNDPPAVQPGLATSNRVCSYDRPGSMLGTTTAADGTVTLAPAQPGRSDPAPMPRDPADVVTELHDLLAAARVPGPYVLVGHSLGGTLAVLYVRTYPDDVSALVTVDSPMPALRTLVTPQQWEQLNAMSLKLDPTLLPGYELEAYDFDVLFDEIEAAPPMPDIPVTVIVRGETQMSDDPLPDDPTMRALLEAQWEPQRESQADFAASVPGAELVTVPGTTHYIQAQRPDAVIKAIREAIARA
jgi:pimeloyl-ACP methyl ester carboxylesterase